METKKINVGRMVYEAINESEYSFSKVAKEMGISRQKLNGWLKKDDWLVKDLFTISKVIGTDLVKNFCLPKANEQEKKVFIQIEIEKNKVDDVLKIINNNQLYNILKE